MKLLTISAVSLLTTLYLSACTIEKRTYLPGYAIEWRLPKLKHTFNQREQVITPELAALPPEKTVLLQAATTVLRPDSASFRKQAVTDRKNKQQPTSINQPLRSADTVRIIPSQSMREKEKTPVRLPKKSAAGDDFPIEVFLLFVIAAVILIAIGLLLMALISTNVPGIIFLVLAAILLIFPVYLLFTNL